MSIILNGAEFDTPHSSMAAAKKAPEKNHLLELFSI